MNWPGALAHPMTRLLLLGAAGALLLGYLTTAALSSAGRLPAPLERELRLRIAAWAGLLPAMLGPVLLGRPWLIAAIALLGLLCLREFDRATGLFREPLIVTVVALGVAAVNFAALDNWYDLFVALAPLTVGAIAIASIPSDRPAGYIQRVGLGVLAYMLFGAGLAHLGYMANEPGYRPTVLLIVTAVALNDVLAFAIGKIVGGARLLPNTSPAKTVSGAIGAMAGTTLLVTLVAHGIYRGTVLGQWHWLVLLGMLVSLAGQAGDLMLSSIKRDLGIKDMGAAIPGHGGLLDRFNSLLLVAPASFHFIGHFVGFGATVPARLITG